MSRIALMRRLIEAKKQIRDRSAQEREAAERALRNAELDLLLAEERRDAATASALPEVGQPVTSNALLEIQAVARFHEHRVAATARAAAELRRGALEARALHEERARECKRFDELCERAVSARRAESEREEQKAQDDLGAARRRST